MENTLSDRVSYHAVYDGSIQEALQYAGANGFAGIQIADETPHLSFERLSDRDIREIARFTTSENLYTTIHAPDHAASLFQFSRYLSAGILSYYRALFSFAHAIGSRLVTIHLGSMTAFPTDDETGRTVPRDDLSLFSIALKGNLEAILEMTDDRLKICVENYGVGLAELELLHPYLEGGRIFLCLDLVKVTGSPDVERFFLDHPEWIKQVHLHDRRDVASGTVKSHRVIGTGDIDFAKYLPFLMREADVEDYCIEVRPREKARDSLLALKKIAQQIGDDGTAK